MKPVFTNAALNHLILHLWSHQSTLMPHKCTNTHTHTHPHTPRPHCQDMVCCMYSRLHESCDCTCYLHSPAPCPAHTYMHMYVHHFNVKIINFINAWRMCTRFVCVCECVCMFPVCQLRWTFSQQIEYGYSARVVHGCIAGGGVPCNWARPLALYAVHMTCVCCVAYSSMYM